MERSVPRDGLRGPGRCRKTGLLPLWPHTSMDCPSHFLLGSHTSDSLAQLKSKSPAVPSSIEGGKVSLLSQSFSALEERRNHFATLGILLSFPSPPFQALSCLCLCPSSTLPVALPIPKGAGLPYQAPPESCTCLLLKFFRPLNFSYTSFLALGTHVLLQLNPSFLLDFDPLRAGVLRYSSIRAAYSQTHNWCFLNIHWPPK